MSWFSTMYLQFFSPDLTFVLFLFPHFSCTHFMLYCVVLHGRVCRSNIFGVVYSVRMPIIITIREGRQKKIASGVEKGLFSTPRPFKFNC